MNELYEELHRPTGYNLVQFFRVRQEKIIHEASLNIVMKRCDAQEYTQWMNQPAHSDGAILESLE